MKLISFVGTTTYTETTYVYEGREYTSCFFPVAAVHAFQPDELLLVLTEEAYSKHFESIADEVAAYTVLTPVRIPAGKTESEIWDIFDILTESIDVGDEVIFDITLSFRSIPMMAVIAAAFWRVAKQVTLRQLIYGAFDAKDGQGHAPVLDLTPMLALMDWTAATDIFLKTGNAAGLSERLQNAHDLPRRNAGAASSSQELPRHLQKAAGSIDSVSKAMRLMRPYDLMGEAFKLDRSLSLVRQEVNTWAKPFAVLLDQTQQEYRKFVVERPTERVAENLTAQLALVEWYVQRDQIVQAITLAREWVVSLAAFRIGLTLIDDRDYAENLLNYGVEALRKKAHLPPPFRKLEGAENLVREWNWLRDLRNDIAHCGMRKQPRSINGILSDAQTIAERLRPLLEMALSARSEDAHCP